MLVMVILEDAHEMVMLRQVHSYQLLIKIYMCVDMCQEYNVTLYEILSY